MNILSVDIGGTRIKWALLPSVIDGAAIENTHVRTMRTLGWLNKTLPDAFDPKGNWASITHKRAELEECDRVAISLCGEVADGKVVGSHLLGKGVPPDLAQRVQTFLPRTRVKLLNDSEAWTRGAILYLTQINKVAPRYPVVSLILGTGVGCCQTLAKDVYRPREFSADFAATSLKCVSNGSDDVHTILGKQFFEWVVKDHSDWDYHRIRQEYTARVIALVSDIAEMWGRPATVILGGGNAEYVSARCLQREANVLVEPLRNSEMQNVNPDTIPLLGAASVWRS